MDTFFRSTSIHVKTRILLFILTAVISCINVNTVYGQIAVPSSTQEIEKGLSVNRTTTAKDCGFQVVISLNSPNVNSHKRGDLLVKIIADAKSRTRLTDYHFFSVNLSKLPISKTENATTGQTYQSEFEWEKFITPSVVKDVADNGYAEFSVPVKRLKWKDRLSAALYHMPAKEISSGNYFLYVLLEKKLGTKTESSCDINSNELSISKDDAINSK